MNDSNSYVDEGVSANIHASSNDHNLRYDNDDMMYVYIHVQLRHGILQIKLYT